MGCGKGSEHPTKITMGVAAVPLKSLRGECAIPVVGFDDSDSMVAKNGSYNFTMQQLLSDCAAKLTMRSGDVMQQVGRFR